MNFDRSLDAPYGIEVRLSRHVARLLACNPGPFTFKGTGVYIVGAGARVAVIDPGPNLPDHIQALKRALGPVRSAISLSPIPIAIIPRPPRR